jgi:glycosyltransferase involved in cell wall biosynthesis
MSKKKILIFIDWFIPAFKAGGPISSVRNLCNALNEDYDIYVVTSDTDLGETNPLKGITSNKWQTIENVQVLYLPYENQTKEKYIEIYKELRPDAVHLNSLFSKFFTLYPLAILKKARTKIIVSPRGMLGPESLKIKPLKKKLFFIMTKTTGLFKNVTWHASSEIEANEIRKAFTKRAKVVVAPNFSYLPKENSGYLAKKVGALNLICVGRIAPIKNIDFLLKSLKGIEGEINCKIIGPAEDSEYFDLCQNLANELPKNITIDFIKGVNHIELNALHKDSHAFISPSKNENFGHSIVEALGHGCPIIISDKTPWKNLAAKNIGADLALDEKLFADAISKMIAMDDAAFNILRNNARNEAVQIFNSGEIIAQYKNLFS